MENTKLETTGQTPIEYSVKQIDRKETLDLILNKHYAKRVTSISFAFGLFKNDLLCGVVTYGMPASPFLQEGLLGKENKKYVIELNRLVLTDNLKNEASMLVSRSLKLLPHPKCVVSYADTKQGHLGIVYQACNFLFTGTTKPRTDIAAEDGKHPRHHAGDKTIRVQRSAKHRYVIFVGNKKDKKTLQNNLKYSILPYPKET